MKKVERLKYVAETFGTGYVLKYFHCLTWRQIERAIHNFQKKGVMWGIRTDARGSNEGFHLPFIQIGSIEKAQELWKNWDNEIEYIIYETLSEPCTNAVAIRLDEEYVLFEYNSIDTYFSQRQMYDKPENVRHLVIGPLRRTALPWDYRFTNGFPPIGSVFEPTDTFVQDLKFNRVYNLMKTALETREITFTVRLKYRQLIIW